MITSIAGIVRTHARTQPDAPAIEYEGRTMTFGELDCRSNQLANALAATGCRRRTGSRSSTRTARSTSR